MSLSICLVSEDGNMLALNGTEIGEVHFYLTGGRESENLGGLTISSRGRGGEISSR